MGKAFIDLTGQRFDRLVVLHQSPNLYGRTAWHCRCDCGAETDATSNHLRRGKVRSCGCLRVEQVTARLTVHGGSTMKEYSVWTSAKDRCFNQNTKDYKNYGGRWIVMVPEWRDSFERFIKDMGPCPPGLTLERIDNDGPYAPGNCKWASRHEQCRNRRGLRWLTHNGQTKLLKEWAKDLGIDQASLAERLRSWPTEKALSLRRHG